ncbi:MAG: DegT/DnrJ/EryC1/StrS family aminotransferase [Fibrobacter sp.]|nr:DegT/DnrJ/EryC1/StrS family aminotransferase [Fibrobacter sp.]
MIPFVNLIGQRNAYKPELEQAERAVFDSGCFIGGPAVSQLEANLAKFCGIGHAIACGSGTEALTVSLMALGIAPGDEVIVPDFTFVAPAECVAALGGIPKFADIDAETLQISPKSVESLVGPATRGIIAVDLFGQCAPYKELREIANRHGLWILEDSAQAFGASVAQSPHLEPRRACTFGDIAITSFYPSKPLGCYGDGGAIFTDDAELARKVRQIANHGSSEHYLHEIVGVNSRLDAIQAAVLNVKLTHFEEELCKRRENAAKYDAFFANVEGIQPQRIAKGNTSTYAQYTLLVDDRNAFIEKLKKAEIPYCIHYPMALHCQPCFGELSHAASATDNLNGANATATLNCASENATLNCATGNATLNCAEVASTKAISLPVCAFTDVDTIIEKLRNVL